MGDSELGHPFFHEMIDAAIHRRWKRLLIVILLFALLVFGLWLGIRMGWLNQPPAQ